MIKRFLTVSLFLLSMFLALPSMATGQFNTYLDYLNSDAIADHPGLGVGLALNPSFSGQLGYFANRSDEYEFNFGPRLTSHDLFGQLLFNTDFDPAVRVGINADIASSVYAEVGYEWLYERHDNKFDAVDGGKVILSLGMRWPGSE